MKDLTKSAAGEEPPINPFRDDVFSFQTPLPGTPQIHQDEMDYCVTAIEKMVALAVKSGQSPARGELISITSPLAGYGKSHLISRISKSMLDSVSTIDLSLGHKASWREMLALTLQNLDCSDSRVRVDSSLLDEAGASFLSNLIGTAVARGIIEERDCPTPLTTLQNDACAAFSDSVRSKLLVWLKKKSPTICSTVKLSSIEFPGFSRDDVTFWTDYFLTHLRRDTGGVNSMSDSSELESRDRVLQLLNIASNCHPLLIIADHLDYCHGSPTAGMEIATTLTTIVENVSNCVLIIGINNDLWDSVFRDKLPSALLDRLSGENLELAPVDIGKAKELVVNRLCSNGINYHQSHNFAAALSEECRWEEATGLFPRKVLRQAKKVWAKRGREFYEPAQKEPTIQFGSTDPVTTPVNGEDNLHTEYKTPPAQTNLPNPFISGSAMVYPDRPGSVAPVPQTTESVSNRNTFSDPGPADMNPIEFSSPQPVASASQPAALHKDEPFIPAPPASKSPVNGHTNGHSSFVQPQNAVQVPPQAVEKSRPLEMYFDQLVDHFEKKSDQLEIDFPATEMFIKTVGAKHPPLCQDEVTIPGGQGISLRWDLKNYIVWVGFEPARNIYYYNNLLQRLLSDPSATPGKIVCFTHRSNPYNHDLITNNGITPDYLKHYFDFIELSRSELVLIHSASQFLRETTEKGYQEDALKFILKKLNPLWQRLCQPIGSAK